MISQHWCSVLTGLLCCSKWMDRISDETQLPPEEASLQPNWGIFEDLIPKIVFHLQKFNYFPLAFHSINPRDMSCLFSPGSCLLHLTRSCIFKSGLSSWRGSGRVYLLKRDLLQRFAFTLCFIYSQKSFIVNSQFAIKWFSSWSLSRSSLQYQV